MGGYSDKAQPYLDAIAAAVFASAATRDWLIRGTPAAAAYAGAAILIEEQRAARWRRKPTKQPFWANYYCGRACVCRIEGSRSLESDAIFFLRNAAGRVLAAHVEFKRPRESFQPGQPEGYPLRAACFARTHTLRPTLNAHDDWATILICDEAARADPGSAHFQRVITHGEAARMIPGWPESGPA
ncbi:MAG: hypothetical protein IPL88_11935 [Rhizobiales bacterium]|nr:hypothetical protein [Hyphomicrobiales bacterium]